MAVVNAWVGATTDTSAWVRARVSGSSVRLAVSEAPDLSFATWFGPDTPTAQDIVSIEATGLLPSRRYHWALEVDGDLDMAAAGQFLTHPPAGEPASFTYGMATCAGSSPTTPATGDVLNSNRISNSPVFDTIRTRALAEGWLGFIHGGDLHYYDIGSGVHVPSSDLTTYRRAYDDVLLQPRQHDLYRNVSLAYVWDDHDFGPNDSSSSAPGRANAATVYRERVPHYPLPASSGPIYQSWVVGRVLFVASDVRYDRDANTASQLPSKTMLGAAQRAWMETLLSTTEAEALVWVNPSQWSSVHGDSWASFVHERAAMVQMLGDLGWLHRMCILSGDAHALSIDTGGANANGGFPLFQFSALDSGQSAGPVTDTGPNLAGPGHYGTLAVVDTGHTIAVTGTGYDMATPWRSHTWFAHVARPALALSYPAGHISPPFEPVDDDQRTRNDITAKRPDGGEERYVLDEGALSVQAPPAGVGRYDESVDVGVDRDDQLGDQAGWRVHLGTVDEARYPTVRLNLASPGARSLIDQVAALDAGDKITLAHPPAWLPPDTIEMLAEGYTETLNAFEWDVEINASPGRPWTVGVLPGAGQDVTDAGPAAPNRADTSGTTLLSAVGSDDTELVVHTALDGALERARWINSAGPGLLHADEFPFDVRLGGEVARVTACEPAAWDTFGRTEASTWGTTSSGHAWQEDGGSAADRAVASGAGTITLTSAPTTLRAQVLPGDLADAELLVTFSVSATATGGNLSPGVLVRYQGTSDYYLVRVHLTTGGSVFLSAWRGSSQVGSSVNARHTYTPGQAFRVRARIAGHTLLGKVWPTTVGEPPLWRLNQAITADTIDTGQVGLAAFAFSGNTNVSPVLSFDDLELITPQRMTVTRSINTVTKPHAAGAALSLDQPAVAGL